MAEEEAGRSVLDKGPAGGNTQHGDYEFPTLSTIKGFCTTVFELKIF